MASDEDEPFSLSRMSASAFGFCAIMTAVFIGVAVLEGDFAPTLANVATAALGVFPATGIFVVTVLLQDPRAVLPRTLLLFALNAVFAASLMSLVIYLGGMPATTRNVVAAFTFVLLWSVAFAAAAQIGRVESAKPARRRLLDGFLLMLLAVALFCVPAMIAGKMETSVENFAIAFAIAVGIPLLFYFLASRARTSAE